MHGCQNWRTLVCTSLQHDDTCTRLRALTGWSSSWRRPSTRWPSPRTSTRRWRGRWRPWRPSWSDPPPGPRTSSAGGEEFWFRLHGLHTSIPHIRLIISFYTQICGYWRRIKESGSESANSRGGTRLIYILIWIWSVFDTSERRGSSKYIIMRIHCPGVRGAISGAGG